MSAPHRLPDNGFAALSSGLGGSDAIRALAEARLSRHLLLIRLIADGWPGSAAERDHALGVLAQSQDRAAEPVTELLSYPLVGAWAARAVRRIRGATVSEVPVQAELGHLGAIAAAAVYRSGLDAEVTAYVRGGGVVLPTIGRVPLPRPEFAPVRLTFHGGRMALPGSWQGLRRLSAETDGLRLDVAFDDLDPYRDGHHAPAADTVPAPELSRWTEMFAEAWALLVRYLPERAEELSVGLRSLVPLTNVGRGDARSSTVRDSFGTFGLTLPTSAAVFAVTLVHEFQHSKLSALLDLIRLYDRSAPQTYYAPWRRDSRPIGGLLQGVYAFLGVADAWRSLRECPGLADLAGREFAALREQVNCALTELEAAGALTAAGRRFAGGMRSTMDRMMAERLPGDAVRQARAALAANHDAWRRRHGVPA